MTDQFPFLAMKLSTAAQTVQVSEKTLRRAIAAGDLVARDFGGEYRIEADELRAWVRSHPAKGRAS
ncbi:helix-turn-helix domain-containing protein [Williamsia serinedens]